MTLRLFEGFDDVSTVAQAGLKGWSAGGSTNGTVSIQAGRTGGNAARAATTPNPGTDNSDWSRTLPGNPYTSFVSGFAFKLSAFPNTIDVLQWRVGATNTVRLCVRQSAPILQVFTSASVLAGSGVKTIIAGVWYYVEVKAVINGASSTVEVNLDGLTEIASTTTNFGSTGVDNIHFGRGDGPDLASNLDVDDIYFCDLAGSLNNNFLGDVAVKTLYPNADGNYSAWAPNSGTVHNTRVNEVAADDDTTYVSGTNVGDRDSYAFGDLPANAGTVFGINRNVYARKDDVGLKQIAGSVRRSGTDYDGSSKALSTSYVYYQDLLETDPSTSALWTAANVNGAEFGIKVVS